MASSSVVWPLGKLCLLQTRKWPRPKLSHHASYAYADQVEAGSVIMCNVTPTQSHAPLQLHARRYKILGMVAQRETLPGKSIKTLLNLETLLQPDNPRVFLSARAAKQEEVYVLWWAFIHKEREKDCLHAKAWIS